MKMSVITKPSQWRHEINEWRIVVGISELFLEHFESCAARLVNCSFYIHLYCLIFTVTFQWLNFSLTSTKILHENKIILQYFSTFLEGDTRLNVRQNDVRRFSSNHFIVPSHCQIGLNLKLHAHRCQSMFVEIIL